MSKLENEFAVPKEFDELEKKYVSDDLTLNESNKKFYLEFISEAVKIAKKHPRHSKGIGYAMSSIGLRNPELDGDGNISIINSIFDDIEISGGSKEDWEQIESELADAIAKLQNDR